MKTRQSQWTVIKFVLTLIVIMLAIAGFKAPTIAMEAIVTHRVIPYEIIKYMPVIPGGGAIVGLVYGVIEAPQHSRPDTRVWENIGPEWGTTSKEMERGIPKSHSSHKRFAILSWELHVFESAAIMKLKAIEPGFCGPSDAEAFRAYRYGLHNIAPHVKVVTSPLPCFRTFGRGAWGP